MPICKSKKTKRAYTFSSLLPESGTLFNYLPPLEKIKCSHTTTLTKKALN